MKNMKVSHKLLVSFLIVTAFSVMLACIGILSGVSTNGNYTYLLDGPIKRQEHLSNVRLQFTMMRYRTANFAMEVNNPDIIINTLMPQYKSAYATLSEQLAAYTASNKADKRRDSEAIAKNNENAVKLSSLIEQFNSDSERTRQVALSGDYDGATTTLRNVIPLTNQINALLDEMTVPAAEYVASQSVAMDSSAVAYTLTLLIIAAACFVISLVLSFYISGLIGKPVKFMKEILMRIGTRGDLGFSQDEYLQADRYAKNRDEIGESMHMLLSTVERLTKVGGTLEAVANGDFGAELALLSDCDAMGHYLNKMTFNLCNMFGEIKNSTQQVSIGSNQISDGAQTLAQGSTQQAAAVQQLSGSISEIADKTKTNAEMAQNAAQLAGAVMSSAEKGTKQMDEMMSAVEEINRASQGISKVIQVIDDIAFQTNILALNAAVEAARAGQHGKGFAVVAEEVRNLAAKSAEAAKDTGSLIANSMEKAQLGARIADETAASLTDIVRGINESAKIIGKIAESSEQQSAGISQINKGINQVAQVVQQNSATAEQSAATAQQLSGQANMLEELMLQYKIRETL